MPEERGLLITGNARDRNAIQPGDGAYFGIDLAGGQHSGEHRGWNSKEIEEIFIPTSGRKIEEHGAGGIAGIGDVNTAPSQIPNEPGIDSTERKTVRFGQ